MDILQNFVTFSEYMSFNYPLLNVYMLRFTNNTKFRKVNFSLKVTKFEKKTFLTFEQHRQNKWKFSFKFLCPFQTTLDLTYLINCFQCLVDIVISDNSEAQNQD